MCAADTAPGSKHGAPVQHSIARLPSECCEACLCGFVCGTHLHICTRTSRTYHSVVIEQANGVLSTLKLNGHADLELRRFVFCERSKARNRQNSLSQTGAWPVECLVSRRCLQSKLPAKLLLARCFATMSRTCIFDSILEQLPFGYSSTH